MEAKLFIFAAVAISEVFSACKPSNVKFSNFWKLPKRRVSFAIGATAQKCPGLNEFYYEWVVEEYPALKTILMSRESALEVDGYTFDSDRVFETQYRVTVKISHYPDMSFSDETRGIFRFTPDHMHIEIAGGLQRGHRIGTDLIVDAKTLSRDSSYPPDEDAFAQNSVYWSVEPILPNYTLPEDLLLRIPHQLLKVNEIYQFSVTVRRTKIPNFEDIEFATQTVIILPHSAPELNIKCIRNCVMPHHLVSTAFAIECTKNCEDLQYLWKIEPEPPPGSIQFGDGFDKIILNNKSFKEGDRVFVSFLQGLHPHTISLTFSSGIEEGNCTLLPLSGISAFTKFTLRCEGFSSPYGLSLSMVFQTGGYSPVNVLLNEISFSGESDFFVAPGDPAEILVYVEDHAYLSRMINLSLTVEQFESKENIPVETAIKELVFHQDISSIVSYAIEGLHNEVVQLISCLLDAIDHYGLDDDTAMDLQKHMLEALVQSETVRVSTALQNMWILWKIQSQRKETDSVTARLIGEVLLSTVLDVHELYVHKQNALFPHYYIDLLHQYTLLLCSDLMLPSEETEKILLHQIPPHDYDSYDEFVSKKIQIRDDYRVMTSDIIVAIQTDGLNVLHQSIPGEKPLYYESDGVILMSQRLNLDTFTEGYIFLDNDTDVTRSAAYLTSEIIQKLKKDISYIDNQFGVFLSNPFWWHTNISTLNTRVIFFDLFIECTRIEEFSTPFLIYLDVISMPVSNIRGLSTTAVVAYRVELKPLVTLVIAYFNEGEHPHDYLVTWSDCVCTEEDFSSERSQMIKRGAANESNIMRVENGHDMKIIYSCVKKLTPVLSYQFHMATFSCLHWDLVDEEWKKEGCKPKDPVIDQTVLTCECYHASLFVGEIMPPKFTRIDNFNIDFAIDFVTNYVMATFISGLLLLWLVSLALAHLKDKSMKKNNVVYKLDDNVPGDSNPYLVVVFTGVFFDAQTTADVAFRLVGKLSHSRTHLIKCQGTTLLKRNSQDWFIIYSPSYLGQITKIKIWHNCKGSYPHWYCDRIIVQDMKIGEQYCFTVKKWFSVIWGTGRIYREIHLKSSSTRIREIFFRTQFEKDMKDKHLWLSVVTRDFQSNFNSKERVSTGFCFLFLSMLANALLLGFPQGSPSDSIDQQSSFYINPSNVFIFIASWIMATFFSFLIIYIFKNSAPL